jgi:hypothetical protein
MVEHPLAIDLFCGLGGWTESLIAEGYDVIGFDIERHAYGEHRYPAQLVLQDVLTLDGSQFRDAALIVASPPCQEFSYMAMPWSVAKAKAKSIRDDVTGAKRADLTRLFDACFRIQREACGAAGRHIPLVIENVRGAQPWIGRARWNFGSYYLWGDVPALMPVRFNGFKSSGMNWSDQTKRGQDFTRIAEKQAIERIEVPGLANGKFPPGGLAQGALDGIKQGGNWWHDKGSISRTTGSKSPKRKFASAMIAKIPLPLSRHIAAIYYPDHA